MLQSMKGSLGARLVVAATATLALTACSSGGDDGADEAAPPASASPSASPSESPSEVQTTPSESGTASTTPSGTPSGDGSVAPAAGPVIAVRTVSFQAPVGWEEVGGISASQNGARRPGGGGLITVNDMENLGTDLESLAQVTLDNAPQGAERLPDVTLGDDGTVAAQLTWKRGRDTVVKIIAVRAGSTINVDFSLRPSDLKADPDLVESVLASWQWVDGGSS